MAPHIKAFCDEWGALLELAGGQKYTSMIRFCAYHKNASLKVKN